MLKRQIKGEINNIIKIQKIDIIKVVIIHHHTRVADLESILIKGLKVKNGIQSQAVKDKKLKYSFQKE